MSLLIIPDVETSQIAATLNITRLSGPNGQLAPYGPGQRVAYQGAPTKFLKMSVVAPQDAGGYRMDLTGDDPTHVTTERTATLCGRDEMNGSGARQNTKENYPRGRVWPLEKLDSVRANADICGCAGHLQTSEISRAAETASFGISNGPYQASVLKDQYMLGPCSLDLARPTSTCSSKLN